MLYLQKISVSCDENNIEKCDKLVDAAKLCWNTLPPSLPLSLIWGITAHRLFCTLYFVINFDQYECYQLAVVVVKTRMKRKQNQLQWGMIILGVRRHHWTFLFYELCDWLWWWGKYFAGEGQDLSDTCKIDKNSSLTVIGRRCVSCMCFMVAVVELQTKFRAQHNAYFLITGWK